MDANLCEGQLRGGALCDSYGVMSAHTRTGSLGGEEQTGPWLEQQPLTSGRCIYIMTWSIGLQGRSRN